MTSTEDRPLILPLETLDVRMDPGPWAFAEARRAEIEAYFEAERVQRPGMWNGRVLILAEHCREGRAFVGRYREVDFASLLWWLRHDCPDRSVRNGFAMAALRSADGAFLLGRMAGWTANAGMVYFAAGTPDPSDVRPDGIVDLAGSVRRELAEETGLTPDDVTLSPGWTGVIGPTRVALMQSMVSPLDADVLAARIRAFLAAEERPELEDVVIVRGPDDLSADMPPFIRAYLLAHWEGERTRL